MNIESRPVHPHPFLRWDESDTGELLAILKNVPHFAGILDEEGRFILASDELLTSVEPLTELELLGKRPGDILGCSNALEAGCGSGAACEFCQASNSIIRAVETKEFVSVEASIPVLGHIGGEAYRFTFRPFNISGRSTILLSFTPGMPKTQLDHYERVFFHDILNMSGSLVGLLDILEDHENPARQRTDDLSLLKQVAKHIHGELEGYSLTLKAQRNQLAPQEALLDVGKIMERVAAAARAHAPAGVQLLVDRVSPTTIRCDESLLFRVLFNMAKNAVEACSAGDDVNLAYSSQEGRSIFSVTNPGVMSREQKSMVFRQGASTKGVGRGWGTFGMKLLGEEILGGTVGFSSDAAGGTVFRFSLPTRTIAAQDVKGKR